MDCRSGTTEIHELLSIFWATCSESFSTVSIFISYCCYSRYWKLFSGMLIKNVKFLLYRYIYRYIIVMYFFRVSKCGFKLLLTPTRHRSDILFYLFNPWDQFLIVNVNILEIFVLHKKSELRWNVCQQVSRFDFIGLNRKRDIDLVVNLNLT